MGPCSAGENSIKETKGNRQKKAQRSHSNAGTHTRTPLTTKTAIKAGLILVRMMCIRQEMLPKWVTPHHPGTKWSPWQWANIGVMRKLYQWQRIKRKGRISLNNPSSTSLIVFEASQSQYSKQPPQVSDGVADLKSGSNILPTHNELLPN